MMWLGVAIGLMFGGIAGILLFSILAVGPAAEREHEAYRRGYQVGLSEPRQ